MKFQEILDQEGIEYKTEGHEHCRSGWIQLDCPWCTKGQRHFRLGYNITGGYLNCWSCGRIKMTEALIELTGKGHSAVTRLLRELERAEYQPTKRELGTLQLPKGITGLSAPHRTYLRSRNFDWQEIGELQRLWEIRGIDGTGTQLQWRIFIPIFYMGRMVSWTSRSISDTHPNRYRSAGNHEQSMDHKSLLYGEDYARHSIVICEGPIDVWKIGPGAVCTFGTAVSQEQVSRMSKYPVRAICFDEEKMAQQRAKELASALEVFPGETYVIRLESGKDPGSASREEISDIRNRFLGVS